MGFLTLESNKVILICYKYIIYYHSHCLQRAVDLQHVCQGDAFYVTFKVLHTGVGQRRT